jgi:hypothetical protein
MEKDKRSAEQEAKSLLLKNGQMALELSGPARGG